jgi:hypothetical protein
VQVATVVLLMFGVGSGIGIVAGGAVGQLLYNWRKEWMPVMAGACVMAGIAPLYWIVNSDLQVGGGVLRGLGGDGWGGVGTGVGWGGVAWHGVRSARGAQAGCPHCATSWTPF